MRVLFLMRSTLEVRPLREMLRLLAGRGHDIHLVADASASEGDELVGRLCVECTSIRYSPAPAHAFNAMSFLALELRRALEAVRAGGAEHSGAPVAHALGELADGPDAGGLASRVRGLTLAAAPAGQWVLERLLRWGERAVPPDPGVEAFLEAEHPDLVLVTALAGPGLPHVEYVRGARALGIHAGLCAPASRLAAARGFLREPIDLVTVEEEPASGARPSSTRAADAIESVVSQGGRRLARGPWWAPLAWPVLSRMAARLAHTAAARTEKATRQRRLEDQRDLERLARRAETVTTKQHARAESALRKEHERARVEAERQALAETAARAYEHHQCVRSWAQRMREMGDDVVLTDTEAQVGRELSHLWDAPPETVARLRRWCEPVSGVRASDYEPTSDELARRLRRELSLLWRQVGRELFLCEAPLLGGFGDSKKGDLYNEDTLRFFKVLVALQDGAVLPVYRGAARRVVWEVGGGWGGFAYQFKTICPNATYLVTSSPERFLLSAVYLMSAFPGARCRFYDPAAPDELWRDWEQLDFVFAPESALASLRPPRLDVMLDLLSLSHMQPGRASAHVERAFDLGCPYTYSLLPDGAWSEASSTTVSAVSRFYWPHPIPPRREQARAGSDEPDVSLENGPAHLVGWRRIRL